MKRTTLLSALFLALTLNAQTPEANEVVEKVSVEKALRYRIALKDKKNSPYSVKRPEEFLSQKSIERRKRMGLKVDKHDLPVNPAYIDGLRGEGAKVLLTSKWNNTALIELTGADTLLIGKIAALPYVVEVRKVWVGPDSIAPYVSPDRHAMVETFCGDTLAHFYGLGARQAEMLNVHRLHEAGLRGEGVTIAVIDGGFRNADCLEVLKDCKILGALNLVRPEVSIYEEHEHGMMALSCIAANKPHAMVGTAPDASFFLIQSEDTRTEYLSEEDTWCRALEIADSLGADMTTNSLGYYDFDDPAMNHKYVEQDGKTALNSRSASLAASRGILVINSAGNEGDDTWKKIGFPADAHDIITVGAVDRHGVNTRFSSLGYTQDGRVKPDVMAQGGMTAVLLPTGAVGRANGTSFSAPVFAGAAACLLQAFPNKRPQEIIRAVQRAGDNFATPNNVFGYGIPDMWKAYELLGGKKAH